MPLRGVIFDLDGTLAETHGMAIDLIAEAIVEGGGPELSPSEVMAYFGRNEQGIFESAVGDGWETSWNYYVDAYVDRHQDCSEPFAGLFELLSDLDSAGCLLGVITAKTGRTGRLSLEVLGIDGFFPEVHGGAREGVTKRRDLAHLVHSWEVDVSEVVYVGDSVSDVEEARAARVMAVAAAWSSYADREALVAAEPDALFDVVGDFADWVRSRIV